MEIETLKESALLNGILDKLAHSRIEEGRRRKIIDEGDIYVSDLTRCREKSMLYKVHPEFGAQILRAPHVLMGILVGEGICNVVKRCCPNARFEVSKSKTMEDYIVRGRCDMILDNKVVEVKFSRFPVDYPRSHHVVQCRLYSWLFDVDEVILWYLNPNTLSEFVVERMGMDDTNVLNMIQNKKSPMYLWECGVCNVKHLCQVKGGVDVH